MKTNHQLFKELIGDIPKDAYKYVDIYAGKNMLIACPDGGLLEFETLQHQHPAYVFAITSHRNNYLVYNQELISMRPKELLGIFPGTLHTEIPLSYQSRYLIVAIRKTFFEERIIDVGEEIVDFGVSFFKNLDTLIPYIEDFIDSISKTQESTIIVDLLEELIVSKIINSVIRESCYAMSCGDIHEFGACLEYMHRNMHLPIRLNDLVEQTTLSKATFINNFTKEIGFTPMRYLRNIRIEKSKHLLGNKSMTIQRVSKLVGFKDIHHYSKTFKSIVGINPKTYRDKLS